MRADAMLSPAMPASRVISASDASLSPTATISRQECFTDVSRLAMVIAASYRDYIAKGMFHGWRVYRKRRNLQEFGESGGWGDAELWEGFRKRTMFHAQKTSKNVKEW